MVRRELTAGQSLRAHPKHIGMFDATVAVQVAEVQGISGRDDTYHCAVLSGPGVVWLRSMASSWDMAQGRPVSEPRADRVSRAACRGRR